MKKLLLAFAVAVCTAFSSIASIPITLNFDTRGEISGIPTSGSSTASSAVNLLEKGVEFTFTQAYKSSSNQYLMIKKNGNITFKIIGNKILKDFTIHTSNSGSTNVYAQLSVDGKNIGDNVKLASTNADFLWTVPAANQVVGTTFKLAASSANAQITKITFTVEEGAVNPNQLSFAEKQYSVNVDELKAIAVNNPGNVTIQYTSSDESVAMVDENTGEVLGVAVGTATIKATQTDDETNSASYELTVVDPNAPGTENNPYTVAQAIAACSSNPSGVYVKGIVISSNAWSTHYNNVDYYIADEAGTAEDNALKVFRGIWDDGVTNKPADNTPEVGATVIVKGDLLLYGNNKTPEINSGNTIVSYTAPTIVKVLGDIVVTLPDGSNTVQNGEHNIKLGQSITASAENAETIKISALHDDGDAYDVISNSWAPEKAGKHLVTVTATLGSDSKEHSFYLNVAESLDQEIVFTEAAQGWLKYSADDKLKTWRSSTGVNFYSSIQVSVNTSYARISDDGLMVYGSANNKITVSAPAGAKIKSVKMNAKSSAEASKNQGPVIFDGDNKAQFECTSYGAQTVEEYTYAFTEPVESFILGANAGSETSDSKNYIIADMTITLDKAVQLVAPQIEKTEAGLSFTVAKGDLYIKIVNEGVTNENAPRRAVINASNYATYEDFAKVDGNKADIETPATGSILIYAQARYNGKTAEGKYYRLNSDGTYTGVEDIVADTDADVAPVYYNMQGVRVANPAAGGLYIKVQGKKATKVLVK